LRRLRAAWVATLLALAPPASAHPPYEHRVGTIADAIGGDVVLVKAFTDGILLPDPVALVLRNSRGDILAETPAGADIALIWPSKRRCLVFRFADYAALWPSDVWEVTGPHLTPLSSRWLYAVGPAIHAWNNVVEYLLVLLIPWASLSALVVVWSRVARLWSTLLSLILVPLALCGIAIWLGAALFSNLSALLLLPLSVAAGGATWRWGLSRLVRGSGPTMG
jgi:hypothetical protein